MADKKKFYSRCDFGATKVGETTVVAGAVEGRVSSKGVVVKESKDGRKYAVVSISVTNQKKNLSYWAGQIGASEGDLFTPPDSNGNEYTSLSVQLSGREVERAEKFLEAGDIIDVVGFLKLSKKDDKNYVNMSASGYKIVRKNTTKTDNKSTEETAYVPEKVDESDDDDLMF